MTGTHKGRIISLILILFLTAGVTACKSHKATISSGNNPLWRVSSEKGTVYLLGSVHLLKHSDYPLNEIIDEAFYASDNVVFELDMSKANSDEAREYMQRMSLLEEGKTLKASLPGDTYARLESVLDKRGMNTEYAQRLKPWALAMGLTVSELREMGFTADFGVDVHYYTKALTMGKNIQALETLEYQIGLFNSMSDKDQNAFVLETLAEMETIRTEFPSIVKAWKAGDARGIEKLLQPCRQFSDMCSIIIDRRSAEWAEKIDGFLRNGSSYFVVAGAAHMVGDKGLVSLLREKGYRVEQL